MKIHSAFRILFVLAVACLLLAEARKRDCSCGKLGTGTNPCTCSEVVVKAAKVSKPTVFVSPEEINEAAGIRTKEKITSITEEKSIIHRDGHHHHHGSGCGCGKKGELREGRPKVAPSFPPLGDLCYPLPVDRSGKIIESVTKVTPAYPGKTRCSCNRHLTIPYEYCYKWVTGQIDGPDGEVIKKEKIVEVDEYETSSGSYDDSSSIVYGSKYEGYGDSDHLGYYGGSSSNKYEDSRSGWYGGSKSGGYGGSSSGWYGGSKSGGYGGSSSGVYGGSSSGLYDGSSSGLYGGSTSGLYGGSSSGSYGSASSTLYGGSSSGLYGGSTSGIYGGSNSAGVFHPVGSSSIVYGNSGSGVFGGSGSTLYGGMSSGIYGGSSSGIFGSGTASSYTDVDTFGSTDSPGCFDNIDEPKSKKPFPDAPADAVSLALAFKSLHPPNVLYKNGKPFVPEDKLSFGHRTVPVEVKYKKKIVDIPEEKLLTMDKPVIELMLSPQQTVVVGSYDEKEEAKLAELEAVERESITKEVSGQVSNKYVSFKDLGYFPEGFPYPMKKMDRTSEIDIISEERSGAPCGPMGPTVPGYVPGSVVVYRDVIETEGPKEETEEVYVEEYTMNGDSEEEEEYDSSSGFFSKLRNIARSHGSPSCSY